MRDGPPIERSWEGLRPELADGVSVDPPLAEGAPWVIAVSEVPRARVSPEFARLAAFFDGRLSLRDAVASAGIAADSAQALEVVDALAAAGLLRPGSFAPGLAPPPARRDRDGRRTGARFRYRAPVTFQWTIFDPSALAGWLARPLRLRPFRVILCAVVVALISLAAVAVAVGAEAIIAVLATPLPIELVPALLLAILVTGCAHEFAHAVTLAALGGRPKRMGIMLFYFMPAFFCDVTDGWRLGGRGSRAAVALSGPGLHLVLSAASFASVLVVRDPGIRAFLVLYGFACLVAVAANLLPFIKLDGYLALVAITDTPYLRKVAATAARRALARALFGVDLRPNAPRDSTRLIAFGALCVLFPLLLFCWAAIRLQPAFLGLGPWMAVIYLALVVTFVIATAWRVVGFAVSCVRLRPPVGRTGVAFGIALMTVSLLLLVPVRATAHAGFVMREDEVLLVSTAESTLRSLVPGDLVELRANGVVLRPQIGTAVVAREPGGFVGLAAPVSALAPVSAPGATAAVWGLPLAEVESLAPLPSAGIAEVELEGARPVGAFLVELLVNEPLRAVIEGTGP